MKVLAFPDVKTFEMYYEGLMTGGTKGAETRTLAKILTKLELQGTPKVSDNGKESLLYTAAQAVLVELEDAEHTLAKRLLEEVVWNGSGAKSAAKLLDFVENVPTKEQYEARKVGILEKPPERTLKLHEGVSSESPVPNA